ncbi:MAG: NUDIX hydrolase [Candidatus Nanopelagicales bacterium]
MGDPNQPLTPEQSAHLASLPAKRMGSGALIRDGEGRVLLVEPTYKATWEIPGGAVERDESPRAACARELREELGLDLPVGRLLVVEWQGPEPDRTESVLHVYDGGTLPSLDGVRLPADELASCRFVAEPDLDEVLATRLSRRVRAALAALAEGVLVELEHGARVDRGPHR